MLAVETRISHIGTKSFTLQQRAVNTVTHQVMCKCTTVMVCCDLHTQQSAELPQSYREGAFGLGAGKWRVIRTVVLPGCVDGVITGCILSVGRILGESAALGRSCG